MHSPTPIRLVSVAEMRALEQCADRRGLSYERMMHNAGVGAAEALLRHLGKPQRVVALIGPGNNGGDGLVCAAHLARQGVEVRAYLLRARDPDLDAVWRDVARAISVSLVLADDPDLNTLRCWLAECDVVLDALLGIGVSRPISGDLQRLLAVLAERRAAPPAVALVALDGVTGMNYDTGALDPHTVPADLTLTFHAPKRGHYQMPAAQASGKLVVVPIGIDALCPDVPIAVALADAAQSRAHLPQRRPDAHKGDHGRVWVIGGCADYVGAPTLAALAAYRVGAGLVTLAVPQCVWPIAGARCPEATFVPPAEDVQALGPSAARLIAERLAQARAQDVVLLGPGMGQAPQTGEALARLCAVLRERGSPIVCDADALNWLAKQSQWHRLLPPQSVLTPHPSEMARLCATDVSAVQSDRVGWALRAAQQWGHVVVLKGAYTVIASPQGTGLVLPFANPVLAVAGTGDVLAGCIAGFMAQGCLPLHAALCGAFVHARAGQAWRDQHGDAGLLASDLLALLPDVLRELRVGP
ncbi:MAG: NAD(P)H-hydrate dehydratase [Thermoflexales bacterium]